MKKMKTKEEMINRYHELYNKMVSSKDPKNMQIFGEAEMYIFEDMAMQQPDKAEYWLSHLEAVGWRNYLSEREAQNIGKRIRNSDGTSGVHWQHDTFVKAVEVLGGKTEDMPYYNSYALCIVACRKRSIPTHSERLNPPTIIAKMALKSA